MSASMATTGAPRLARYLVNSADSVVLPLPPLPTNATRTVLPFLVTIMKTVSIISYEGAAAGRNPGCVAGS
jgi:hypothetical protein